MYGPFFLLFFQSNIKNFNIYNSHEQVLPCHEETLLVFLFILESNRKILFTHIFIETHFPTVPPLLTLNRMY